MFRLYDSRSLRENGKGTSYQKFVRSIQVVLRLLQRKNTTMGTFRLYVQENYMEKPRDFDPFGQAGLSLLATI